LVHEKKGKMKKKSIMLGIIAIILVSDLFVFLNEKIGMIS